MNIQIIRKKRKTSSIKISNDGTVTVSVPLYMTNREINKLLEKHRAWIEKHLEKLKNRDYKFLQKSFIEGEEFLYLGEKYKLKFDNTVPLNKVIFNKTINVSKQSSKPIREILINWYKEEASTIFKDRLKIYANLFNLKFTSYKISSATTRWGSCTPDNRIFLSYRLVMAPIEIIDYVVTHELSHTVEKNHSKNFWALVEQIDPQFKKHRKWLRDNGYLLQI